MAAKNESNELKLTRLYDAPVKLVWDAWTDPAKVAKWWGPRGFTLTTHSKDLRPGGHWAYTMHGPDGTDFENKTIYHEVEKYSKLVYDHGGNDDRPPLFRVTVTFKEIKGKTQMDMTMTLPTPEAAREIAKFIKQAGGNSTWDRLGEYLGEQEGKKQFVINRSFAAPIATVFNMWTDPNHFSKWLPPVGFTMEYLRSEIKPGSSTFYKMSNHKDFTMYGLINYQEITPVHKIVYTQQFCDENGKVSGNSMHPIWPETMLSYVTLTEEGPDQTRVTVTWEPSSEATAEEVEAFMKARPDMTIGWTGSFDKLEELFSKG